MSTHDDDCCCEDCQLECVGRYLCDVVFLLVYKFGAQPEKALSRILDVVTVHAATVLAGECVDDERLANLICDNEQLLSRLRAERARIIRRQMRMSVTPSQSQGTDRENVVLPFPLKKPSDSD